MSNLNNTQTHPQATYRDTVLHKDIGIHDGDQLMEEVRLRVKQLWGQLLHDGLQLLRRRSRHSIPSFRFTPGEEGGKKKKIYQVS